MQWSQDIVKLLLQHGANIGMKNRWNQVPVTSISPETLEEFLDGHCLTSNADKRKQIDVQHRGLEITFDYSVLAPPAEDLPRENRRQRPPDDEERY